MSTSTPAPAPRLRDQFEAAGGKPTYVRRMFGRIARVYDLMNFVMTAGLDRRWRLFAARQIALRAGQTALDVGTGTGDLAIAVAQVSDRADQAVAAALGHMGSRDVVFVGHSHFSRSVITRWVELPLVEGSRFWMLAGSIAVCGFEHGVRQLAALGLTGNPQAIAPG